MIEADIVVLGAGPAGATAALNLAPFHRVLVLERGADPARRTGESLPPAARRLLTDMGLWPGFLVDGHRPCHVSRSIWGGEDIVEADTIRDPAGPAWLIDRARFDARLRATAMARGAAILSPAQALSVTRIAQGWHLSVAHGDRILPVRARGLIDARGRRARPWPDFSTRRRVEDRLVCGWIEASADSGSDGGHTASYTEAEADGWWYTASLPQKRRLLAFYTDADLPAASEVRSSDKLVARAMRHPRLALVVGRGMLSAQRNGGFCAAHGCRLEAVSGAGWIAVGDAACGFDPLSSQGLFNALFSALAAAEAMHRAFAGDPSARVDYEAQMTEIWETYRRNRAAWYRQESRWSSDPFWARRRDRNPVDDVTENSLRDGLHAAG